MLGRALADTAGMIDRELRIAPSPSDHAILSLNPEGDFQADWQALITDQASGGCCLVFFAHPRVAVGTRLRVQLGKREPVRAQVIWMKDVPPGLVQAGLQYLE